MLSTTFDVTWEVIALRWFHQLVIIDKDFNQLLVILNVGSDKSFVDDLVASGYCKCERCLCTSRHWGLSRVPMICSSLFPNCQYMICSSLFPKSCPVWCKLLVFSYHTASANELQCTFRSRAVRHIPQWDEPCILFCWELRASPDLFIPGFHGRLSSTAVTRFSGLHAHSIFWGHDPQISSLPRKLTTLKSLRYIL